MCIHTHVIFIKKTLELIFPSLLKFLKKMLLFTIATFENENEVTMTQNLYYIQ